MERQNRNKTTTKYAILLSPKQYMTTQLTPNNFDEALRKLPQQEILALASKLYDTAKTQIGSGQPCTQEEMAILNDARKQLRRYGLVR